MQTKSKHTQLLAAALTIALLLAGILTLLHGIPLFRADAAEAQSEEANVYADWKFSEENSSGSLEDNTLVIEDASGNGNDLEIVTSENGAKASDFLAFEDISMTGDAQSMKFNGFKEEDQEQLDTLTGDEREEYILNDLEYAYLRTADEAPINQETFMNGYTIELVFMMPVDYDASDAWMNILAREGSGANLGSGQWDYEGHHGTMQINISNCKEIQYMTQNGTNTKFNSTLWGLSMDNGLRQSRRRYARRLPVQLQRRQCLVPLHGDGRNEQQDLFLHLLPVRGVPHRGGKDRVFRPELHDGQRQRTRIRFRF